MKNILILSLLTVVALSSCTKGDPIQLKEEAAIENPSLSIYNKWLLTGGTMYTENLETGQNISYNHFDATKTVSSLRWDGPDFPIERIVVDSTTWAFTAPVGDYGEFILNQDTLSPYGLTATTHNITIIEHPFTSQVQMGGSARPIWIEDEDYNSGIIYLHVQEMYESIGGQNYKIYSVLEFTKTN